jgi:hypothetical protein
MMNARWSFGCTIFELSMKEYLMYPAFVKGQGPSDSVKVWCQHHKDLKSKSRLMGPAEAVRKRVYGLRLCHSRRIVWNCCHPDPTRRALRLTEDMNMWNAEWSTTTLFNSQ